MNKAYVLVEHCVDSRDVPYYDKWESNDIVRGFYSSAELARIAMRTLPEERNENLPPYFVCSLSIYRIKQDILLDLDLSMWNIIDRTVDYTQSPA